MTTETKRTDKGRYELPEGWRRASLGSLCRVVSGSTPSSGIAAYWSGDVVWITPSDLGKLGSALILGSDRRITRAGCESCGTSLVPPGSVVISSRAPIGHVGIAAVPLCTNQGCKTLVPGPDLDSRFLYFAAKRAVPELQALGRGATFTEISKSQVEAFSIDLPPLTEQRRIAAILAEQTAAVERARAAAQAQREAAKALPAAYLRAVFDSPEAREWPRRRLGEVLRLRKEVVHPHDNPSGSAAFVGLEHIETGTGRRAGGVELRMEDLTGRKPRFHTGDIVYGYLRPYLNKLWIAEFDGLCSVDQYVYSVTPSLADAAYVAWFMRSPVYLETAPIDTTPGQLPRIRTEEVASVTLSLPPLSRQRSLAASLDKQMAASERLRAGLAAQVDALGCLPAALLGRAFNGGL